MKKLYFIIIISVALINLKAQETYSYLMFFRPDPSVLAGLEYNSADFICNNAPHVDILHIESQKRSLVLKENDGNTNLSKSLDNFKLEKEGYIKKMNNKYYSNTEAEKIDNRLNPINQIYPAINYNNNFNPDIYDYKPNIQDIKFGR